MNIENIVNSHPLLKNTTEATSLINLINSKIIDKGYELALLIIGGSHAYGTSLPTSDIDVRGVYIQPTEDILANRHVEQVSDGSNDIMLYEMGRFIELLQKSNPNVLEYLYVNDEFIVYCSDYFKGLFPAEKRKEFVTKQLRNTFGGYSISQIKKAKGLNKKINWEQTRVERKTPLDFCYVLLGGETSVKFDKWHELHPQYNFDGVGYITYITNLGLAKVNNVTDLYSMYWVEDGGIIGKNSNDVQLRSIPKNAPFLAYLRFDRNAYSQHCKDYREYNVWLEERSEERYKDNLKGEIGYDHKNILHCIRLLETAIEIAKTGDVHIFRKNAATLLKIRNGIFKYDEIIHYAETLVSDMDTYFPISSLPDKVGEQKDFLQKIRLENFTNGSYYES